MKETSRIALQLPHDRPAPLSEIIDFGVAADKLGYDTLLVPESWTWDAFTTLGAIAVRTRGIRLGPGIVNVFSRTPALIAQSIATLDELSGGRAVLGLGISGPVVIENWHGIRFEHALERTRETVEIVRMALRGEQVRYSGRIFKLKQFRLGFKPTRDKVPIFIASIGPKNNRLAGEIGDGWHPIWLPRQKFEEALAEVGPVAEVAPTIMTCVGNDREALFNMVRPQVAYYVGGMGTFYRNVVARFGFEEEASRIHDLWQGGQRKQAVATVSDGMVDQLAAVGTADECRERIDEYRRGGATLPVIAVPHLASRSRVLETLEALV